MMLNFRLMRRFRVDNGSRWILAAGLALALVACSARVELPPVSPSPSPTMKPLPTVTPPPSPLPDVEYRRMPPTQLGAWVRQEADSPFPVLVLRYRPRNACSLPGDYQVDWQPGKVLVYVHQLVGHPDGGCPTGRLDLIVHHVPLDRLVNGDEIFVNDEFRFIATNLICEDYRASNCPVGCAMHCVSSYCSSDGMCTADCDGPGSCRPP